MHSASQKSPLEAPAALGLLINLSGKMRMLSHRIAMFILSGTLSPETANDDQQLRASLDEFHQIYMTLKKGNPDWGISAPVVELISHDDALGPQFDAIIESFIARTRVLMTPGRKDDLNTFVQFVAGPLLGRLNDVTNHISRTLDRLHDRQRQQAATAEAAVHEALSAIEKVSINVRIIAINAATEAVRAGEFGRGFSIIAKEIRALSDRAAELVQSVRANLR